MVYKWNKGSKREFPEATSEKGELNETKNRNNDINGMDRNINNY